MFCACTCARLLDVQKDPANCHGAFSFLGPSHGGESTVLAGMGKNNECKGLTSSEAQVDIRTNDYDNCFFTKVTALVESSTSVPVRTLSDLSSGELLRKSLSSV